MAANVAIATATRARSVATCLELNMIVSGSISFELCVTHVPPAPAVTAATGAGAVATRLKLPDVYSHE